MPINLERYRILKECKGNKSNRIFIVEDKQTSQTLILKIIKIHDVEKQLREIEVHKRLNHKYVIKLADYDVSRSYILLLVEYAKYGDLFTHLGRLRELSEKSLLKFYFQVVKAIHYLHSNGFVHRDIKPENILITRKFSPRVADFGTSAQTDFIKNTYCGTAEYMAPEIMLRLQQSEKVDVWALGILLYEMMHNFTPFKNENAYAIQRRIEEGKIRFKQGLNPAVQALILKILRYKPSDRPSTYDILTDPLFADFLGNVEDKREEFCADKTQDWDKKVDVTVQNRLREFKKSLTDPKAQKPGPLSDLIGAQGLTVNMGGDEPKSGDKSKSVHELASIEANKASMLKDRSSRENSKINEDLCHKTNFGMAGKSVPSFVDFSEKNSHSVGSNIMMEGRTPLAPKFQGPFGDHRNKCVDDAAQNSGVVKMEDSAPLQKKNFVSANVLDRFEIWDVSKGLDPKVKMLQTQSKLVEKDFSFGKECSLGEI